jgi:hypothetical protein
MSAWVPNAAVAVAVLLSGVALLLAAVGLASYRRVRHGRLLWVALAFVGFVAQGLVLARDAYVRRGELAATGMVEPLLVPTLSLAIVLALYIAVLKR